MKNKTGGAAFPSSRKINRRNGEQWTDGSDCIEVASGGMTLRDYFAAKCMQGDIATQDASDMGYYENDTPIEHLAKRAELYYRMADAMLKARG